MPGGEAEVAGDGGRGALEAVRRRQSGRDDAVLHGTACDPEAHHETGRTGVQPVAQNDLGAHGVAPEVDDDVVAFRRRGLDALVCDRRLEESLVGADLHERGRRVEHEVIAAGVRGVEQAQPVTRRADLVLRPRHAVDQHDVAEHPGSERLGDPGVVDNVGSTEG